MHRAHLSSPSPKFFLMDILSSIPCADVLVRSSHPWRPSSAGPHLAAGADARPPPFTTDSVFHGMYAVVVGVDLDGGHQHVAGVHVVLLHLSAYDAGPRYGPVLLQLPPGVAAPRPGHARHPHPVVPAAQRRVERPASCSAASRERTRLRRRTRTGQVPSDTTRTTRGRRAQRRDAGDRRAHRRDAGDRRAQQRSDAEDARPVSAAIRGMTELAERAPELAEGDGQRAALQPHAKRRTRRTGQVGTSGKVRAQDGLLGWLERTSTSAHTGCSIKCP